MSQSEQSDRPRDSWLERVKAALGLTESGSIREDLADALQEPELATDFSPKERMILVNVLGMRNVRVSDVMTPRARMIGVGEDATLSELFALFQNESHARLPVYGDTPDDPKGMVHIRDFLAWLGGDPGAPLAGAEAKLKSRLRDAPLLRPILFVPPSMAALDLMVKMQAKRLHMALVINEYGETDGIVTMEDLVEAIVGDIDDEHDMPEPPSFAVIAPGKVEAMASASLEEVSEVLGIALESDTSGVEVDSLGGLVTGLAGRVPQVGEKIEGPGSLIFEIVEADPRRIRRLIIHGPAGLTASGKSGSDSPPQIAGS
ncbi:MAG TPA: hemolysin family protein [Beijerinckiaceae bacterium]|nr:hemolysin family protein [Beijerinckiaceae bacterium]